MIKIKTKEEIEIMREGAQLLVKIIKDLEKKIEPGITTNELNMAAESHIFQLGAKPSFKGYGGFPAALCTSVNEEVVHGVPSERVLKEGDIITIDLGILYKGYHSDMAVTVPVGEIDDETRRLVRVTKDSLRMGINKVKPGRTVGDVGNTIQRYIESQGYNVVRELCGHGIGKNLHEDPQILNYGKRKEGAVLKEGMVLCLEPMVTVGDWNLKKGKDGQTFITRDNSLSCHFEHEVVVTSNGCEILTKL